jgi:hypothetical protein
MDCGYAVRTTLMTGFPGESEKDFEELLSYVKETQFERLGVFAYSAEEGTAAAVMEDQVDPAVGAKRRDLLLREQRKISLKHNKALIGQDVDVLVDGVEKKGFASWVKNAISAIIGALLSFGVTMGIVTTEQEKVMNEKLGEINKKSESIVEDLKAGKVKEAMETAKAISADTKEIIAGPDVVSRGFVYVRESEDLMDEIRNIAYDAVESCRKNGNDDWASIKNKVKNDLATYLYNKTKRNPMLLPVIMEV